MKDLEDKKSASQGGAFYKVNDGKTTLD